MDEQARKQQPLNPIKESLEGPDLALVKRLRELYQHSKYDGLSELAKAVGLSTSQVSRVLSGERRPAKTFFESFFFALEGKNGRSVTEETRTDTLRLYYTCIRPHRPYEYQTFVLEQEKKKIQEELEESQRLVDQIQGELLEARTARDNLAQDYRALEQSFAESEVAKSGVLESLRNTRVQYEQARKQISEEIVELAKELRQAEKDRDDAQRRCNELQDALQKAHEDAQAAAEEEASQKYLKDLQSEKEKNKKLEDENRALRQRVESILTARNWLGLGEESKTPNDSEPTSSEREAALGGKGKGVLPVEATVTQFYGETGNRGIDFAVPKGTSVKAITDGTVVSAGWNGPYGYEVILRHADGLHSQYAHLSTIAVKASQSLKMGQRLGRSGSTGDSMHPHLHFEVRTTAAAGTDIDPVAYLATLGIRVPRLAKPSPTPQPPAELLVTAQIRLLRSHEESKRAAAVQELTTMIGEFPRSAEEITGALCAYIRRSPTEQENGYLEASARAALVTVLSRPRVSQKPLDLTYANLSSLNLENMNMTGVLLRGANLKGACLDGADLRYAQLQSANLANATLNQTDLSNADLSTATGITAATLNNAIMNSETTLPSGKRWTRQAQNESLADRNRPGERPDGPWDITEVRDPVAGRVDLGGLLVPGVDGMELRVEVAGDAIVAATVVLRDSAIQLQAFAAPKREGIWSEVREELSASITQQGGIIDEVEGPLGWELRAQVPVQLPDGTDGFQIVRFVGVDGPRWFLRGVISGQGAVQPQAAGLLEQIFRDTVVVRGEDPMAPRDPIVLKLPNDAQMAPQKPDDGTTDDPRASA